MCGTRLAGEPAGGSPVERRFVTVLFGDLSEFTAWAEDLDPERVGVVTDRVLAALAEVVSDHGGHVDKLTGDGIMAVFGAPTAHEDDAERAVRAAAGMQAAVRRLVADEAAGRQLGLRVGLNSGEVLAGVQAALSYTVVGDTVNTAARLSDAAGVGAVLAGSQTAAATAGAVEWRALAPLRLKGKREPVAAFELVAVRPPRARPPGAGEGPFVGRDAELGRLCGRLDEVRAAGTPAAVLMLGDAGVGKTRLALELGAAAAQRPGVRMLWGRCTPYGVSRDLAPLLEMVRSALGLDDPDSCPPSADRARRAMAALRDPATGAGLPGEVVDRLLAFLGLTEGGLGGLDAVAPGSAPGEDAVLGAVAALFRAEADDGLLLVVDDLQWASPPLLDALLAVGRLLSGPVLLLALGRPDLVGLRARWRAELTAAEVVDLAPLGEPAAAALLRAYLGGELDSTARDLLLARAQGNPFFLSELVHLLVDRGLLQRTEDGRWQVSGALPQTPLPAGVQAVLATRIDALAPAAKAVLRDAAVIGTRFPLDALLALGTAAGHGSRREVADAVALLSGRRLLQRTDHMVTFAHALVRDVAYAGIPKAERARRHAAVAAWAASGGVLLEDEADALLAAQAQRAVRLAQEMQLPAADPAWAARDPGAGALHRMGVAALARDDNAGAERSLARERRLLATDTPTGPPPPQVVEAAGVAHARALARLYRLQEAAEALGEAPESADQEVRAQALAVLGEVGRKRGDDREATRAFVSAMAAAGDAGLDRVTGDALRQLGLIDHTHGRLRAAEERFRNAYVLAERVGDRRGAAWALRHLAWSETTRGDYAAATATLERATEVFESIRDAGGLVWSTATEGFIRLLQGRFGAARSVVAAAAAEANPAGDARWGHFACLTIDAIAAAELGSIEVAAAEADRACDGFAEIADSWGQALALVAGGIAARGAGDPTGALDLLGRAVEGAEAGGHPVPGALARVAAGYCHLDRAEWLAAEDQAHRAMATLAGLELEPHAAVGAQVLLALARRAQGDLDSALGLLEKATATLAQPSLLFPRRQALAHHADTLLQAGRPEAALTMARRAMAVPAEDIRSRVTALRALGAALAATGDHAGAASALREALEVASSSEQRGEVSATERALAALDTD